MCFDPIYMDHHQDRKTIIKNQKVQIILHTALWNLIMYSNLILKFRFQALSQNCEKILLPSSCLSVCLSVSPRGANRLPLDGFSWIWYLSIFQKIYRKYSRFVKIWQEVRALHTKVWVLHTKVRVRHTMRYGYFTQRYGYFTQRGTDTSHKGTGSHTKRYGYFTQRGTGTSHKGTDTSHKKVRVLHTKRHGYFTQRYG